MSVRVTFVVKNDWPVRTKWEVRTRFNSWSQTGEIFYLWTRKYHLIRLYSLHYTALCMPDLCKSARESASGWMFWWHQVLTHPQFSSCVAALGGLARYFFTFTIFYDGESHSSPAQLSTTMPPSWLSTAASVGMAVGPPLVRRSL